MFELMFAGTITAPNGKVYRPGLGRDTPHPPHSHLYEIEGSVMDFGKPMCWRGWNRGDGTAWSIWRGNVGELGTCRHCIKRALKGLPGVDPRRRA